MTPKQQMLLIELALVVYESANLEQQGRINDALQAMHDEELEMEFARQTLQPGMSETFEIID